MLLKVSALGGALLYGVLFLGYYSYYDKLGLHPEDLGVSYTYILVRSIGFVVIMGVLLGLMSLIHQSISWAEGVPNMIAHIFMGILLFILLAIYVIILMPQNWHMLMGFFILLVLGAIIIIGIALARRNRNKGLIVFSILALLATIIYPTAVIINRANNLAKQALSGKPVVPYELFGMPILDVSARTVTVTWIGSTGQRPATLGEQSSEPARGLLLGVEAGTVVLLISNPHKTEIVKFPSALVMIEGA